MRKALVGYTGFVGSNLANQTDFSGLYNSKNISQAFSESYDLVIYCGVKAEKYLANQNPETDYQHIEQAFENIRRLRAKKLVLISTIDVYDSPGEGNENTEINMENLNPYGYHRFLLEKRVVENIDQAVVIRLPALYGKNIKKNFIFDMMKIIPSLIKVGKFEELRKVDILPLEQYYTIQPNGFYRLNSLSEAEERKLKQFFYTNSFNALSFTDSRNEYQFYPLTKLWEHITISLEISQNLFCFTSEPLRASVLFKKIFREEFRNEILTQPIKYNIKSIYSHYFGGRNGYFFDETAILNDISQFVKENRP